MTTATIPITTMTEYLRDPAAIYAKSFETVRRETDLSRFTDDVAEAVIRLVHACGMPDIAHNIAYTDNAVIRGREAISRGSPIFVDAQMVGAGIIKRHLNGNDIVCTLDNEGVADAARAAQTTRSAAAVECWGTKLEGAVVAIGNAPTALFRLLELIEAGGPKPAVILGFPVGFVGAAESKELLATSDHGVEFITLNGRVGGSAIASAAVNALAGGLN